MTALTAILIGVLSATSLVLFFAVLRWQKRANFWEEEATEWERIYNELPDECEGELENVARAYDDIERYGGYRGGRVENPKMM